MRVSFILKGIRDCCICKIGCINIRVWIYSELGTNFNLVEGLHITVIIWNIEIGKRLGSKIETIIWMSSRLYLVKYLYRIRPIDKSINISCFNLLNNLMATWMVFLELQCRIYKICKDNIIITIYIEIFRSGNLS